MDEVNIYQVEGGIEERFREEMNRMTLESDAKITEESVGSSSKRWDVSKYEVKGSKEATMQEQVVDEKPGREIKDE